MAPVPPQAPAATPEVRGLRVDWLTRSDGAGAPAVPLIETPGRIALSACPGRPDLGGDVRGDLERLVGLGIKAVVTLVADREMEFYGVFGLRQAARAAGLRSFHLPCVDTQPPDDSPATHSLCGEVLRLLGEGHHVLIHCIGGWGRSGTIAACLLTHEGYAPMQAIELVRTARSPRCVESRAQERFVHGYASSRTEVRRQYTVVDRAKLRELLQGDLGSRRLRHVTIPAGRMVGAAELPQLVAQLSTTRTAAGDSPLVILSGEIHPEEHGLGRDFSIDRAYVCEQGSWRPAPFAELLR
jgi:protein-tyrosine phosphatase